MNGNVRVYRSGQGSCDSSEIALHTDAVSSDTNHATVWLAHNYYRLKTNRIDTEMCDECLFDLNDGADDEGSVNRDIYLAFNRVISGRSDRNGYGTCMVKLAWVCNVVNNN